jgi:D-alanyl-D-alanine dipeptidase
LDIRYATSDNFTGAVLPGYGPQSAWLRKEAARALARVQRDLEKQGLGLIVFDGYRPIRASKAMVRWAKRVGRDDLLRASYISRRSKHNLGIAVDVALYDRKTGKALAMGTDFDEFSPKSHTKNATGRVLRNRLILRRAMRARGFLGCRIEWWHFHWPVPKARPMDVTYTCE